MVKFKEQNFIGKILATVEFILFIYLRVYLGLIMIIKVIFKD